MGYGFITRRGGGGELRVRVADLSWSSGHPVKAGDQSIVADYAHTYRFKVDVSDHCYIGLYHGAYYYDGYVADFYETTSGGKTVSYTNATNCMCSCSNSDEGEEANAMLFEVIKTADGYTGINCKDGATLFSGWSQVCINGGNSGHGLKYMVVIDLA